MTLKRSILTGLITTAFVAAAMTAWAGRHAPPTWEPSKELLTKLAAEPTQVDQYSIQAPPTWVPQLRGGPGKIGTEFDAPDDTFGNHPYFTVLEMGLPNWGVDKRTPADFLDLRLNNIKRTVANWKPSKYETGIINGIPFARCRWTGSTPNTDKKIQGFMYVGRESTFVIEIQGVEAADRAAETLPLLETAAMTLKKHPKPLAMITVPMS